MQATVNGFRMNYKVEGPEGAPPVVLHHSLAMNLTLWDELTAALLPRYRVVRFDARGHGESEATKAPYTFETLAADVVGLMDHLKIERAHFVGLSMGGMIVQDFYGRHPERVATLALVDTSSGFGGVPEEVRRDFLARRLDPLEKGLTPADIAPSVVEVLVGKGASAAVREQMRASMAALRTGSYKQALHAIVTTDFRAILSKITVPTLVIVGEEDVVTPPSASEFLVKNITGASLVKIPGSGHLSNIEKSEAFNAALESFLNQHAQRASAVSL